ncbi:hypothetical protein [Bradyrhizobium sp. 191]|uniref:hypothetical protein n=1 Tax=Bradyrhizobium sp. 191 TaxID=2782659 RepID=UPI001FFEA0A5|nr:hypothetical protein [Bradyrhizobium sp. 191]
MYSDKATAKAKPVAYTDDWSIEGGSRAWLSRGTFQWDFTLPPPMPGESAIPSSRLTYQGLDGVSGELFARLDNPWGIFLKGNIGVGRFKHNNEDSSIYGRAYSNMLSSQANGRLTYYTADVGYDFLRDGTYKLGAFLGWTYYGQKSDTVGCLQIASPTLACLAPGDRRLIGSQDTDWNAPRVGLSAEAMLLERWRLGADVAYLPWTDFNGRDHHLLDPKTRVYYQRGNGGAGVQIETMLSYFLTNNFSIGVGARYWAMWTKNDSDVTNCRGCIPDQTHALAKYSMERWGTFFQASYKLN